MLNHLARLAAAVLVTAAAGVVVSAPAEAAACSGSGVTVVVDFHELGGGVQQACVPDGDGRSASDLFTEVGFPLTRVQTQPGFVCRVRSLPADDPCVKTPPATAFWSLWSSDGSSGSWAFASIGVDGLSVSDGGSVALSWKAGSGGDGSSQPGVTPPVRAAAPAPAPTVAAPAGTGAPSTKKKSKGAEQKSSPTTAPSSVAPSARTSATPTRTTTPSAASSTGAATPSPTATAPTPSATATSVPTPVETTSSAPTVATTPTQATEPSSDAPASDDGGLPSWLAPVLIVLVFGAGAAVAVVRRRRT